MEAEHRMPRPRRDFMRVALPSILLAGLAACNPPRVMTESDYQGAPLPKPERVLVRDFAIMPEDVRLDQGLRARLTRMTGDAPMSAQQMQVARGATATLSEALVQKLRSYGIPAQRSSGYEGRGSGHAVLIEGQIVSVDEGNKTRRTLVGLGAGKSSIETDAQLFYSERHMAPRLLEN